MDDSLLLQHFKQNDAVHNQINETLAKLTDEVSKLAVIASEQHHFVDLLTQVQKRIDLLENEIKELTAVNATQNTEIKVLGKDGTSNTAVIWGAVKWTSGIAAIIIAAWILRDSGQ